jgi:hypothetical protein
MLPSRSIRTSFDLCLPLLFLAIITTAAAHDSPMSVAEALAAFPDCAVCYHVPAQYEMLKCDLTRRNQRPCIGSSITHSGCIPTDVFCLCNDRVLTDTASSCVRSSCTVKETLSTNAILLSTSQANNGLLTLAPVSRNISSHVCGLPVETDATLIPVYSTFIAFAVVAVVLRLVARVMTQAHFWWDDLANMLSFVRCFR